MTLGKEKRMQQPSAGWYIAKPASTQCTQRLDRRAEEHSATPPDSI